MGASGVKKRLLTFAEKLLVVDMLRADAVDSVIKCATITEYGASVAHRLGKDAVDVNPDSVKRIADEVGIAFKPVMSNRGIAAYNMRVTALEGLVAALNDRLSDALRRIEELERLYVEEPRAMGQALPDIVAEGARKAGVK